MNLSINNGNRRVQLNYVNGKGTGMATTWHNGRLADISVD